MKPKILFFTTILAISFVTHSTLAKSCLHAQITHSSVQVDKFFNTSLLCGSNCPEECNIIRQPHQGISSWSCSPDSICSCILYTCSD